MAAYVIPPGGAIPEPLASSDNLRFVSIGITISPMRDRERPTVPATVIATDNLAEAWPCYLEHVRGVRNSPNEVTQLLDVMAVKGEQRDNSAVA